MHERYFEAAVTVSQGASDDLVILSLSEMAQYLGKWRGRRGQLHEIAVRACDAAAKDFITMEQARRTLVAFAAANGKLRLELEPRHGLTPQHTSHSAYPG